MTLSNLSRCPWGSPQMKESRVGGDPCHHSTIKYGVEDSHLSSKTNANCKQGFHSSHLCGRPGFNPWVGKIPWWRAWQPTPVFLLGESPWTEEPSRLQYMGSQRVGHDWGPKHSTAHLLLFFNFSSCLFSSFLVVDQLIFNVSFFFLMFYPVFPFLPSISYPCLSCRPEPRLLWHVCGC